MTVLTRAAAIIAATRAHGSLPAPARACEGREKALDIGRRQGVDAGSPRAAAPAESKTQRIGARRRRERRAHADRVCARASVRASAHTRPVPCNLSTAWARCG